MAESRAPLSRFATLVKKLGREERCRAVLSDPAKLREAFARAEATMLARKTATDADRAALEELEGDLAGAFLLSPEAATLDSMSSYEQLFELARTTFGRTVMAVDAQDLAKLVFEVLPRNVLLEAEEAGAVIGDLHAFYMFLARVFSFEHAAACLEVLGEGAAARLGEAIAQSDAFARERAIFADGTKAGFDMHTREGIEAYLAFRKAQARLN
jgi:hypothetical protein